MQITVFGATGQVGQRIVAEAIRRNHKVTAVSRSPSGHGTLSSSVTLQSGDAGNVDDVVRLSKGKDLIISATRPVEGDEQALVDAARILMTGLRSTGVRLILVGGAGSLDVPGNSGRRVFDDPSWVPCSWRPIAQACSDQYDVCLDEETVDWTYASPPAVLEPGERTGTFRLGSDDLLIDGQGKSEISMEDFAVAILDEAERPSYRRKRFTVAY